MEKGVIERDVRDTVRSIRGSMHGNVIRALVELITNSDDSYIRLEDENVSIDGVIEILYAKDKFQGRFAVCDNAEGMTIDDVRDSFKYYGKATSGLKKGKNVRGYFGHGAKDALASMINGRICTIKDGNFIECRLYIENEIPYYEIDDLIPANAKLRKKTRIIGNGTSAYFVADPNITGTVPRLDTIQSELANNYLLRKIMTNPKRKVLLKTKGEKPRTLRYKPPKGMEVLSDDFIINFGDFGEFPIHFSLWRADTELLQTGEDRTGGLLLVDDEDIVLDLSLFKYDNEPLAAKFFGEVKIGGFRQLLINEEPVLREDRVGLNKRHKFCKSLIEKIEERLENQVKIEKLRQKSEEGSKIDREESSRFKEAFNILNEIAKEELQDVENLGEDPSNTIQEPKNGFCFYPASAEITVGKRYSLELRISTKKVGHGSLIKITSTQSKIRFSPKEIRLSTENGIGIVQKYITIVCNEPNIDGIIKATTGDNVTESRLFIKPEEQVYFEGLLFQPKSITIRPNRPRKISLHVYTKLIQGGSLIELKSDNDSIILSKDQIIVNESDAIKHVAKYDFEVWGEGEGQDAIICAECGTYFDLAEIRVRSITEKNKKGHKGMFSDPEFNYDQDPNQRTSYSLETGKVVIYVNFPSIKLYLGQECQFRKTLPSQVLVADLIAERSFYEIAKKKVETSGALLRPASKHDRIQRDANELSKNYGDKLHQALVDQNLIKEAKETIS